MMISKILKRILYTLLVGAFLLTGKLSFGQANRTEITGAYVYNFAKLSSSPKQKQLNTYTIVLISGQEETIKEFRKMEKEQTINDKKISLTVASNADIDFTNSCLVFISADKTNFYPSVFEKTKRSEVLLISENYTDKPKTLINLYDSEDGKLLFEMNKGNIYQRQITIKDEVLLMGGTEIDLVELYLESQKQLNASEIKRRASEQRLKVMQDNLRALDQQILETQAEVKTQKDEVEKQRLLLDEQKGEREKLTSDIKTYKNQIDNQKEAYQESEFTLKLSLDSLEISSGLLSNSKNEIAEGLKTLEQQQKQIEEKNDEITLKESTLAEQGMTITRQQNVVIVFIIIFMVISVLIILLYKNFKEKQKKNVLLEIQKKELNQKNEALRVSLEEIKQIQQQLVQSEKMASLGVLSAGIAHEINNPINFVYAGINSLLRDFEDVEPIINAVSKIDPDSDNLKEKLNDIKILKEKNYFDDAFEAIPHIISDIKIGADRTAEIVKGLRSFSRTDQRELQLLNIHEGLDTSLLLLKNKYKTTIKLTKQFDDRIPEISCHPGQINQAFLNIISNAIDAIEGEGEIWISTTKRDENVIISIKDTGSGMTKELQEKLFDPFFTTKPVGEGTGLGLSITYGIIKEHKGTIEVLSKSGKGSEFIITLPIL